VLELAMSEARELNHSYVGTEHLLLGLLREEKGVAAQVLVASGLMLDNARAETLRLLGTEQPAAPGRHEPQLPDVATVTVEIRYADGTSVRGEFLWRDAAITFLKRH
jgi:ATP-dependent Clp protease ATP-binding subunit ClpC